MKPTHLHRYRLRLRPLSPIHIGSGQTIDPCEFVLRQQNDGCFLIVVDLPRLLADLSPARRSEFDRLVTRGDFPQLRSWLGQAAASSRHHRFVVQVQEPAFKEIEGNLDNPQRLGEIHLFTRDPASGRPYLPGSSIKGAIRTAIIDHLAQHDTQRRAKLQHIATEIGRQWKQASLGARFEAAVMGNLKDGDRPDLYHDPLRQLSISDLCMPPDACYIDRIRIVRPKDEPRRAGGSDPSGIVIYRELTWSSLDDQKIEFSGEVRLAPLLSDRATMGTHVLPQSLDVGHICQWCNGFYVPRLTQELDRFVADEETADALRSAAKLPDGECLIRLGHHSHFECVTVGEPFRQPPRGFGKTRSYAGADPALPLGWAVLRFDPWDDKRQQD